MLDLCTLKGYRLGLLEHTINWLIVFVYLEGIQAGFTGAYNKLAYRVKTEIHFVG